MDLEYIEIENFRGIKSVRLPFAAQPRQSIFALVGLNESGKTTILDAINHFSSKDENLNPLRLPGYSIADLHSLIPISERANFNGTVQAKLGLRFTKDELTSIRTYAKQHLDLTVTQLGADFIINSKIVFRDSKHDSSESNVWWFWLHQARKGKSRKVTRFEGDDWAKIIHFTKRFIPAFLYFPTFLFDFPERIYLESIDTEREKHAFYALVLQDILDVCEPGTTVKTHLLDRAKSNQPSDKRNLDSLLRKMGRHVTHTIFSAWNEIFRRRQASRRVVLTLATDETARCFVQFQIEDADGYYQINERSMGFRWFFAFLLLTQYRAFRKTLHNRSLVFLFDEPAANLHSSAQVQLLKSFEYLANSCTIIYTTHSHHMIDPRWLDGTFVVKNRGITYAGDQESSSPKNTDITAMKYREFSTKYPEHSSYYQPILDVLDYAPSALENVLRVIITEGKSDYYVLKYVNDILLARGPLNLIPGTGSGNNETLIKLYLAWNRPFLVLLDADDEGRKQEQRYRTLFGILIDQRVFTLESIDPTWKGFQIESMFEKADLLAIQNSSYPDEHTFGKVYFHRALQELYLKRTKLSLAAATLAKFRKLFEFADDRLQDST